MLSKEADTQIFVAHARDWKEASLSSPEPMTPMRKRVTPEQRKSWNPWASHGTPGQVMEPLGKSWNPWASHGTPGQDHGTPGQQMSRQ